MRRTQLATVAAASLLLALSACGEEKPDPIPSSSASPTPSVSVSPAPDAPALNAEKKAAYEAALRKYAEFESVIYQLGENPVKDDQSARALLKVVTKEKAYDVSEQLDEFIDNDAHTEGRRDRAWSVPVSVKTDAVTLKVCDTPGDFTLVGKGQRELQTVNTLTEATIKQIDGRWYVTDTNAEATC